MTSLKKYRKLVFFTSRFPYPLEKGDKLRAFYQIKELSKFYEVHLISLSEHDVFQENKEQLEQYCESISVFQIRWFQKWSKAIFQVFGSKPFQVGYFHHLHIQKKVNQLLEEIKPDSIFCQLIRTTEYVKNYHNCPKVLDYMDALSLGMQRRIKPKQLFKNWIFRQEAKRLSRYENIIFEYFEYHTIISEQDREHIFHKKKDSIVVIPNGVDKKFFDYKSSPKTIDLIFTGNMSYPPNVAACKFIVYEILPKLPSSLKLMLSGASPTKEVLDLMGSQVIVTGWVDDIRSSYQKGKIFVAPMLIGTGLQNKLLEAMAMGVPCITTPLANNALNATPDTEIVLATSSDEFVAKITQLLSDLDYYTKIAGNGRAFVKRHYNWKQNTLLLMKLIDESFCLGEE